MYEQDLKALVQNIKESILVHFARSVLLVLMATRPLQRVVEV